MTGKVVQIRLFGPLKELVKNYPERGPISLKLTFKIPVRSLLEKLKVPQTEIAKVTINGKEGSAEDYLYGGEYVCVYPVMYHFLPESLNIESYKFLLDVHLGRLCKFLRMMGFDSVMPDSIEDEKIILQAANEKRILLSRDRKLLMRKNLQKGYLVRSENPRMQAREVVARFGLKDKMKPLSRCLDCNTVLVPINKNDVSEIIPPKSFSNSDLFFRCPSCGKILWHGSHADRMLLMISHFAKSLF